MCCENNFDGKLTVQDAFTAALFYDYCGNYSNTFDGHRQLIVESFGCNPDDMDPIRKINHFIRENLEPFRNVLFVSMEVYRDVCEYIEYVFYTENGEGLIIEWLPNIGPVGTRWL